MNLEIVVLAAGQSTRMKSNLPKVLHELGGRPLLTHVLNQGNRLEPSAVHVVVSPSNQDMLKERYAAEQVNWVLQEQQQGTGHAVLQALPSVAQDSTLLVLYGDVPRLREETLRNCVSKGDHHLTILSAYASDPSGYGRILRDREGLVTQIIEDKDLPPESRSVNEINSGIMCGPVGVFRDLLPKVNGNNQQNEIYLTDLVGLATRSNFDVQAVVAINESEILGINSRSQLAQLERNFQAEIADNLMDSGVTLLHPESLQVRGELITGLDCTIDANVQVKGKVVLGDNVSIGSGSILKDTEIQDNVRIYPQSVIEGTVIGTDCEIGPSARLRPGTVLHRGVRIGNFVEIKNATLEDKVKAGHLAYIGDATLMGLRNIVR